MGQSSYYLITYTIVYNWCVVHGALLHPDPDVVLGRGYAMPPFIQRMGSPSPAIQEIHLPRKVKVVNSISEFDEPGGWMPVKEKYDEKDFEDGFKKDDETVMGPPYGDILVREENMNEETVSKVNLWKPYYDKTQIREKQKEMSYQKSDRKLEVEPELITKESIDSKLDIRSIYNFIVKSVLQFQHSDSV